MGSGLKPVTDPDLLKQLDASPELKPVTDERVLFELDNGSVSPTGSFTENVKAGVGKAFTDLARGAGQRLREALTPSADALIRAKGVTPPKNAADLLGLPNQADIDEAARIDKPLMNTGGGVTGNIVGGAAAFAPLAAIPGANSAPMAGLTGAAMGLLKPTQEGESPSANAAIGAATGTLTALAGGKVADVLEKRAVTKAAEAVADKTQNATRDAALSAGRQAGYVVPPASVKPGLVNEMAESVGGKIATAQSASVKNQKITDDLARQYVGLQPDSILSKAAIADAKNVAAEPYRKIADVSPEAKAALDNWKQANFDAKMQWNYFRKSGNPEAYTAAQEAGQAAEQALNQIEAEAGKVANGSGLVQALKDARVKLGKLSTIDSAMTKGGHVDASLISKMAERMPFKDELKVIADFAGNFPKAVQSPEKMGGMAHALRPSIGAGVGTLVGGPAGAAVGAASGVAVPWTVRQMLLSGPGQRALAAPSYGSGISQLLANGVGSPLTQAALPPATVSGLLYGMQQ